MAPQLRPRRNASVHSQQDGIHIDHDKSDSRSRRVGRNKAKHDSELPPSTRNYKARFFLSFHIILWIVAAIPIALAALLFAAAQQDLRNNSPTLSLVEPLATTLGMLRHNDLVLHKRHGSDPDFESTIFRMELNIGSACLPVEVWRWNIDEAEDKDASASDEEQNRLQKYKKMADLFLGSGITREFMENLEAKCTSLHSDLEDWYAIAGHKSYIDWERRFTTPRWKLRILVEVFITHFRSIEWARDQKIVPEHERDTPINTLRKYSQELYKVDRVELDEERLEVFNSPECLEKNHKWHHRVRNIKADCTELRKVKGYHQHLGQILPEATYLANASVMAYHFGAQYTSVMRDLEMLCSKNERLRNERPRNESFAWGLLPAPPLPGCLLYKEIKLESSPALNMYQFASRFREAAIAMARAIERIDLTRSVARHLLILYAFESPDFLNPQPLHNLDDQLPMSRDTGPAFRECEQVYDWGTRESNSTCPPDDPRRRGQMDPILAPLCAMDVVADILGPEDPVSIDMRLESSCGQDILPMTSRAQLRAAMRILNGNSDNSEELPRSGFLNLWHRLVPDSVPRWIKRVIPEAWLPALPVKVEPVRKHAAALFQAAGHCHYELENT